MIEKGGAISSRSFDLLDSMIYDLKRSVDLRWCLITSATFIHRWSCYVVNINGWGTAWTISKCVILFCNFASMFFDKSEAIFHKDSRTYKLEAIIYYYYNHWQCPPDWGELQTGRGSLSLSTWSPTHLF